MLILLFESQPTNPPPPKHLSSRVLDSLSGSTAHVSRVWMARGGVVRSRPEGGRGRNRGGRRGGPSLSPGGRDSRADSGGRGPLAAACGRSGGGGRGGGGGGGAARSSGGSHVKRTPPANWAPPSPPQCARWPGRPCCCRRSAPAWDP